MKLSDYAKESIVEAIKERYDEAVEELKNDKENRFKLGYYEALFEVLEVIENRKDW